MPVFLSRNLTLPLSRLERMPSYSEKEFEALMKIAKRYRRRMEQRGGPRSDPRPSNVKTAGSLTQQDEKNNAAETGKRKKAEKEQHNGRQEEDESELRMAEPRPPKRKKRDN